MNCRESRKLIAMSVDGELSQRDTQDLSMHLLSCPECSHLAEGEAAFVKALRARRSDEAMPLPLRRRLLALVQGQQPEALPKARWAWKWSLGPALAACALAFLLLRQPVAVDWTRYYLQEHAAHEAHAPQLQYASSSPAQLAAWFQGSLQRKVHIPYMPDAKLLGGSICRMQGQRIGMAVYQVDGKTLSLFMGDQKVLCPSGWMLAENQIFAQSGGGISLAAWSHGDHLHVAVSEVGLTRLKSLALECQASAI